MAVKMLGCIFCNATGTASVINQHVRGFHQGEKLGRKSKLRDFHHIQISHAFEHKINAQPDLVSQVSPQRLLVLCVFAVFSTVELNSEAEIDAWQKRHYNLYRVDWWDDAVLAAIDVLTAAWNNMDALNAHVKRVVDKARNDTLRVTTRRGRGSPEPEEIVVSAGTSRIVSITAGGGTSLTMEGDGFNRTYHGNSSKATFSGKANHNSYIYIPDDTDDDDDSLYDTPPPRLGIPKRGKVAADARSVSSTIAPTTATRHPSRSTRVVSAGPSFPTRIIAADHDREVRGSTPMETPGGLTPFMFVNVTRVTNKTHKLEIEYGTTLAEALAQASEHSPEWIRELGREMCFEGEPGGDWGGVWPEWRWDCLMGAAQHTMLTVDLRLVFAA